MRQRSLFQLLLMGILALAGPTLGSAAGTTAGATSPNSANANVPTKPPAAVADALDQDGFSVHGAAQVPLAQIAQDTHGRWVLASNSPSHDIGMPSIDSGVGSDEQGVGFVNLYIGDLKINASLTSVPQPSAFHYDWISKLPGTGLQLHYRFRPMFFNYPGYAIALPGTFVCQLDAGLQHGPNYLASDQGYPPGTDVPFPAWFLIPDAWARDMAPALKAIRADPALSQSMPATAQTAPASAQTAHWDQRLTQKYLYSRNPWLAVTACRLLAAQGALDTASIEHLVLSSKGIHQAVVTYILLRQWPETSAAQQKVLQHALAQVIADAKTTTALNNVALGLYVAIDDRLSTASPAIPLYHTLVQKQKSLGQQGPPDAYLNTIITESKQIVEWEEAE